MTQDFLDPVLDINGIPAATSVPVTGQQDLDITIGDVLTREEGRARAGTTATPPGRRGTVVMRGSDDAVSDGQHA